MSISAIDEKTNSNKKVGPKFIDTDIHERLPSTMDLLPYLEDPWVHYVKNCGWSGPRQLPWVQPMEGGVDRLDAKLSDGKPAGSSYEVLKEQLLDQYNIEYGILTGLFYPSTMRSQFEFATAVATAYNNWLIDNWLEKDSRFLGSIHVAGQDPKAAAREIDRLGSHPRFVQVMLPIGTQQWGDPFYDPIYEAAERNGLVVAFHQSSATPTCFGTPRYFIEWRCTFPQAFMSTLVSVIFNGVLDKFPNLKIAMIEGGFAWLPSLLWRMDSNYRAIRREVPWVKRFPREYIKDHVYFSTQPLEYENPKHLLQIIEMAELEDNLVFGTDYPHWDFDSPLQALPGTIRPDVKEKIFYHNAKRLYGL